MTALHNLPAVDRAGRELAAAEPNNSIKNRYLNLGFGFWISGFRIWGLGFEVKGLAQATVLRGPDAYAQ